MLNFSSVEIKSDVCFIGFSALEKIIVYGYFFFLVLVPWRRSLYMVTFFLVLVPLYMVTFFIGFSALEKIIVNGYKALNLQYFFTSGKDEVKAWTVQVRGHRRLFTAFICLFLPPFFRPSLLVQVFTIF